MTIKDSLQLIVFVHFFSMWFTNFLVFRNKKIMFQISSEDYIKLKGHLTVI